MAIILNIIVIAIIVFSIFLAYKKGLIKTLFSLLGGVVAVVLAISMSAPVAGWLNREYIGPAVRKAVLTAVNGTSLGQGYEDALQSIDVAGKLQEMPENLQEFLEKMNVDVDKIVASAEQNKAASVSAKEELIKSIADPASEALSNAVALIGLVIVFFLLLFVATRLLDTVFRVLPFGKSINRSGGIIFGALRAALLVLIFGAVVYGLACGNVLFSLEDLENTFILKYINLYNPILNFLK